MKATKKKAARKTANVPAKVNGEKAIKKVEQRILLAPSTMTEATILDAFDMLGITAKLDEQKKRLFVAVAKANNLNPLRREIHAVERTQKVITNVPGKGEVTDYVKVLVPVVGFEVFIDRAEQSGRLAYWNCITTGSLAQKNLAATVTIKRKDWSKEFTWTVRHEEVSADNPMWKKEPTHMTEKVAISRAFRLCFRDVLRDMPYTAEEEASIEVPPQATPIAEPRALPSTTASAPARQSEEKAAPPTRPTDAPVPVQHEETAKPRTFLDTVQHYLMATEADPKSKLRVALFTENERIDYMHNAREASGNIEEEKIVLDDIIATGKKRRAAIKGE